MLSIGEGLAVGLPITAAILKFLPGRNNKGVAKEFCEERHSRIDKEIVEVKKGVDRMNSNLDEVMKHLKI